MHIHMYIYTYIHTYTHVYIYTYIYTHIELYTSRTRHSSKLEKKNSIEILQSSTALVSDTVVKKISHRVV